MFNKYLAQVYQNTSQTLLAQSEVDPRDYPDLIDFSVGDPDLVTSPLITKPAMEDALAGHTHYAHSTGDPELREEICNFFKEDYGMEIGPENIMVSTSACHGMWLVLEAILNPGDEVIVPQPSFTVYPDQVRLAGGSPVLLATRPENKFKIDLEDLEAAISPRTKAIIINTPNNPTGACMSVKELEDLGKLATRYDLLVISDDIYTIYTYQDPFVPPASIPSLADRTISLRSFSKNFVMTGWRLGYIVGPPDLVRATQYINENNVFTAPSISQRAGIYALRNRKTIQADLYKEFKDRVFHTAARIRQLKNISVPDPQGTFYLFPDIRETGLSSVQVRDLLLEEAQVLVLPGLAFGPSGEGFIRLAMTLDISEIDQAFDRLEKLDIFK